MLLIPRHLRRAIEARAEAGYPREVCGFLVGRHEGDARRVKGVRAVRNAWEEEPEMRAELGEEQVEEGPTQAEWEAASAERRFLIDPRDTLGVDREARELGLEIVGFYHSHPNHPAEPSRFDREMAMPEQSWVIVSVRDGRAVEFRSWVVADFDAPFSEEEVAAP